ncbi:response regulator [Coraliomargarita parva]|uniref:response regulator n=1 Tax=Coraliomargarita parva TaxID=3014050 RepID=UPI0022B32FE6|nr:response regulator transcription factor [Coraliomargarita parva]
MKDKTTILLVDDHTMMVFALAETIAEYPDLEVVGEASTRKMAVEKYRETQPDVVIMDYQLGSETGVAATREICEDYPDARIVMYSIYEGEEDVWRAVEAGASGYLHKSAEVSEILDAVREVAAGHEYFPAVIAKRIAERKDRRGLTAREMEVLHKIVSGCSNKEIMSDLHLSEATVKLHVSNVLAKLGVADRTQAAIQAVRRGIIHLHDLPDS